MGSPPVDNLQFAKAFGPAPDDREDGAHPNDHLGEHNHNPLGMSLWALWREDFRTHGSDLMSQGFWALAVHRFGNWRMDVRPRVLRFPLSIAYRLLEKWIQITCGVSLSYTVKVGRRVRIWHFGGMILGARVIGNDVHIRQNTTFGVARRGDHRSLKPVIEDRVDVGTGVVIAGGIVIGHDSVIGANAVVLKDVPPYSLVVGIPGKVIKTLRPAEAPAPPTPDPAAATASAAPIHADAAPTGAAHAADVSGPPDAPDAPPPAAPASGTTPWDANGQSANGEPIAAPPAPSPPPPSPDRAEFLAKARDVEF